MNRKALLIIIAVCFFTATDLHAVVPGAVCLHDRSIQDTVRKRQILYNGAIWRNSYAGIKGDPFLFTSQFLPGSVKVNGNLFSNVELKYDICSDQLLVLKDFREIVQLNKEMTDFFSLTVNNRVYRFIRVDTDSIRDFSGYVNELYKGQSVLYVKYIKEVENIITGQFLGEFNQMQRIFIKRGSYLWLVRNLGDFSRAMDEEKSAVRRILKKNKLKISRKDPESFIPVLNYFDNYKSN